jgi:hypothetical protein
LKFLVTSFECFGGCRFAAAAIAVHTARKISSAETATNLRPADADDPKLGGTHMIEHLADVSLITCGSPPPRVPTVPSAAASHMTKANSRGMT